MIDLIAQKTWQHQLDQDCRFFIGSYTSADVGCNGIEIAGLWVDKLFARIAAKRPQ